VEVIRSSETSVHTRSTRRHIPEDGILHSHRCENLKSYIITVVHISLARRTTPKLDDHLLSVVCVSLFIIFAVELKLNRPHQLQAYASNVNRLDDNIDTIKKNTETLIGASKEVCLEVNAEITKYTSLSRRQNAGQNHDIKIVNSSI
jgi:hypothetical protein